MKITLLNVFQKVTVQQNGPIVSPACTFFEFISFKGVLNGRKVRSIY